MNKGLIVLVFFYIFLIIRNYRGYATNKTTVLLTMITAALSIFMLCSSNTADLDWSEVQLDMSGYRTIYEKYNAFEYRDSEMYYLFYGCMHLGQYYEISYRTWWAIMSVLAMSVIFIACRVHKYNFNLFLATFLAYHEMVFFSGFKFFYGFCFMLLAYGFLLRDNLKGKLLFILFTCVAGGFHMMYFFYLLLLFKSVFKSRFLLVVFLFLLFSLISLMRVSDSALSFLQPFFDALDNEHINNYTLVAVHFSFYLSLAIHLVVVFVAYSIRKSAIQSGNNTKAADVLFNTVLLSLFFCPFYTIALTFLRLITAFSLIVITAGSTVLADSYKSRLLCVKLSLLIVISFHILKIITGGFWDTAIVPYFDVL